MLSLDNGQHDLGREHVVDRYGCGAVGAAALPEIHRANYPVRKFGESFSGQSHRVLKPLAFSSIRVDQGPVSSGREHSCFVDHARSSARRDGVGGGGNESSAVGAL